jgi:hypothetical protein
MVDNNAQKTSTAYRLAVFDQEFLEPSLSTNARSRFAKPVSQRSVPYKLGGLREHIDAFIASYNETAESFAWTKFRGESAVERPKGRLLVGAGTSASVGSAGMVELVRSASSSTVGASALQSTVALAAAAERSVKQGSRAMHTGRGGGRMRSSLALRRTSEQNEKKETGARSEAQSV